jgi:hypothetical protein
VHQLGRKRVLPAVHMGARACMHGRGKQGLQHAPSFQCVSCQPDVSTS